VSETVEISVLTGLDQIAAAEWDACAAPEDGRPTDPFTTHRFLSALETSGSVGAGTGWAPRHLVARVGGQLLGVMPLYAKGHSQGEYIFDFNWAHAYERAGGQYYPKLQCAVPFTPATGRRFLLHPDAPDKVADLLAEGARELVRQNKLSSFHITFCTKDEWARGPEMGLMQRKSQQFHWVNAGFSGFDDYLAALSSRKRKNVRRERATAQAFGGEIIRLTGDQIQPEHWDYIWAFYQDTGSRKWGTPYLTRDFFDIAHATLRDDILLILAVKDGVPIAGALNFIGADTLYGRYWGCTEHHDCLHFEICYYQAIEAAIEMGLARVEAGAQGEHKLARGYLPVPCYSLHWIAEQRFAAAVQDFLVEEGEMVVAEIDYLSSHTPFAHKGDDNAGTD